LKLFNFFVDKKIDTRPFFIKIIYIEYYLSHSTQL